MSALAVQCKGYDGTRVARSTAHVRLRVVAVHSDVHRFLDSQYSASPGSPTAHPGVPHTSTSSCTHSLYYHILAVSANASTAVQWYVVGAHAWAALTVHAYLCVVVRIPTSALAVFSNVALSMKLCAVGGNIHTHTLAVWEVPTVCHALACRRRQRMHTSVPTVKHSLRTQTPSETPHSQGSSSAGVYSSDDGARTCSIVALALAFALRVRRRTCQHRPRICTRRAEQVRVCTSGPTEHVFAPSSHSDCTASAHPFSPETLQSEFGGIHAHR
ncbi:hypothetical protein DFP72DRAFT_839149 [Ephemerocybe angulata]|uniref:Uncharacterized protein n=1 Tax=Ephemerocybe angulata TaxID=980116 RepID=A0A8H6II00_9AGAR|nr:hypothetical protein DFP72DRAFT_839149 [Tulosesus angulatus]